MKHTLVALSLFLSGCVTTQLSPQGASVRPATPGTVQTCKHLGMVQAFKAGVGGGLAGAQVELRNRVGAAGGNAFVVSSQVVEPPYGHATIIADAYQCPSS